MTTNKSEVLSTGAAVLISALAIIATLVTDGDYYHTVPLTDRVTYDKVRRYLYSKECRMSDYDVDMMLRAIKKDQDYNYYELVMDILKREDKDAWRKRQLIDSLSK